MCPWASGSPSLVSVSSCVCETQGRAGPGALPSLNCNVPSLGKDSGTGKTLGNSEIQHVFSVNIFFSSNLQPKSGRGFNKMDPSFHSSVPKSLAIIRKLSFDHIFLPSILSWGPTKT